VSDLTPNEIAKLARRLVLPWSPIVGEPSEVRVMLTSGACFPRQSAEAIGSDKIICRCHAMKETP
jgi:hypothetical protein